jgi:DNA modification methylase
LSKSYEKVPVEDLVTDLSFTLRQGLNQDALLRYRELLREKGSCPALKVQKGTMRVIDGWHRLAAAKAENIKELGCEILDVPDSELRALAYSLNAKHGVPLSIEERNKAIVDLYTKDGKTQEQIAKIVGLSQRRVGQILEIEAPSNTNIFELSRERQTAIIRLILKGEKQEDIAKKFDCTQGYVSQVKSRWFDSVLKDYEGGSLKRDIAEKVGLELSEVDAILETFGDPLNFKPEEATLWPTFGIDERFGKRHPGNIPAGLVRNILCRLTKPGDLVLDPFAGGGVVIDVCADMVNRKCEAFDLTPVRDEIRRHDILSGPPPTSRPPDLIFLDPPYGPQKEGEYSDKETDLSNLPVDEFLNVMERIFKYWDRGWLVCLMTVHTREGLHNYVALPAKIESAMERAGWNFEEWIVNKIGRAEGTDSLSVSRLQKANWWSRRDDLHILIGRKSG